MAYIENIVIGTPICPPELMFAADEKDWQEVEKDKTFYTEERFLPTILVELGIAKSNSAVKKNKPDLFRKLDRPDFLEIKWGKRKFWILVGR